MRVAISVALLVVLIAAGAAIFFTKRGPSPSEACDAGDARACVSAGDPAHAEAVFKKQCEAGQADACLGLGDLYATALEGPLLKVRKRSCELGSARGCAKLGRMLREGDYPHRVNVDPSGATAAYERACTLGDGEGCVGYGTALLNGRGTKVDRARAAEMFGRACDAGVSEGCDEAKKLEP